MTIKEKIIDKVNSIDDKETLKEILRLVSVESKTEQVYHFDEWEEQQVREGLDDIENGRVYSQEESDKLISEWLFQRLQRKN
jgi:hypothetical protein